VYQVPAVRSGHTPYFPLSSSWPSLLVLVITAQHKTVKAIEFMICDALEAADPYIKLPGTKTDRFPTGEYKVRFFE